MYYSIYRVYQLIELLRNKVMEPLKILGDRANEIDIEIKVTGGGNTGQTDAARTAMAKGIVKYFSAFCANRLRPLATSLNLQYNMAVLYF